MRTTYHKYLDGSGFEIRVAFGPMDFQGGRTFSETERYKKFLALKEENPKSWEHSDKASAFLVEWLSKGYYSYYFERSKKLAQIESEEKRLKESNELTIEKCLEFLKSSGYNFLMLSNETY